MITAFSFSRLNSYEECPKKYNAISVDKTVKEEPNEVTQWGTDLHLAIAKFFRTGERLPLHMQQYQKYIDQIRTLPGQFIVEQKLAINAEYQATGWFDKDVYCRIISDLTILNGDSAVTFDWKTGKMKPGFMQLRLSSAVLFLLVPELQQITHAYVWFKDKRITKETMKRAEMPQVWADLLPKIQRYHDAHVAKDFPPRPSYLCRGYCPVKTCQYWEPRRG